MFSRLKDLCVEFPWEDEHKPLGKFFLIKDTISTNANFIVCQSISAYLKGKDGVTLVGACQGYAHYLNSLKRTGQNIVPFIIRQQMMYIDMFSQCNDWVPLDLPFVEETHSGWAEPPSCAVKMCMGKDDQSLELQEEKKEGHKEGEEEQEGLFYKKLVQQIELSLEKQEGTPAIVIDNLTTLFERSEKKANVHTFVSSLLYLCRTHAKQPSLFILSTCTFDHQLQRLLGVIETYADAVIETFDNPSGHQKDIAGQLVLKIKQSNTITKYLYALSENQVDIKQTYTV